MNTKADISDAVLRSFANSPFKWRTARGVSKDSGIEIQKVAEFLERSDKIVRARKPNKSGQALYTVRDRYQQGKSFAARLYSAITNVPD